MRARNVLPLTIACGLLAAGTELARAQRSQEFDVTDIKVDFIKVGGKNLAGGKAKPGPTVLRRLDQWMEIDVQFRAEPGDVDGDFIDELEVKIHILTPEDKKEGKWETFTCELRFAPVPKSRELYASAYLSPVVVERWGGSAAFQNGSNVAAEVFYKGRPVAEKELKTKGARAGDEGWYTRGGKKGVLLPRSKTPFALDYWDRYLPEAERN